MVAAVYRGWRISAGVLPCFGETSPIVVESSKVAKQMLGLLWGRKI